MASPRPFIDEATIRIKAGDGGHGMVNFLREKYRPKGGPAGGDGGKGGDVYLKVATGLVTLEDFQRTRFYQAERGGDGQSKNRAGKAGKDLVILVPPGTIATDVATGQLVADLSRKGMKVRIAIGGEGGLGNQHFATATNRVPTHATPGKPGEDRMLHLELRLLADVGLVGFPNAGKSTFLNRVSNAKPRIANYPFTTLRPSIGLVRVGDFHSFTMADIPGIIEEAHAGKGLGLQFLRHIARTKILCHLVEIPAGAPADSAALDRMREEYDIILAELQAYGEGLVDRPRVTVLNKADVLQSPDEAAALREAFIAATGCPTTVYVTSTQEGNQLEELVLDLLRLVQQEDQEPDPHADLEIRYTLPEAHLNIRHTTRSERWWEQIPGQLPEDLAAGDGSEDADDDDPEGYITIEGGEVIPVQGPRRPRQSS
ncbi:MAG: GTPase Obg [bacterium]|nr:GTPase Obg [bacterium]